MKVGFLGIGSMGGAVLYKYARVFGVSADQIFIANRSMGKCLAAKAELGNVTIAGSNVELCKNADVIIIGVTPQCINEVFKEIAPICSRDKIIVSMAAGISIGYMEKFFCSDAKIVRTMPNIPAVVGESMTAMSPNENVMQEDLDVVAGIFNAVGLAKVIDESLMDCVIGTSGSSPAYTYIFIKAMIEAAMKNGMDEETARAFIAQSVLGAAKMVMESPLSVEQLIKSISLPKGTTVEAIKLLNKSSFEDIIKDAFQAAVDRSAEISREELQN